MAELAALWIVRHGESTANVAATAAEASGAERIDLSHRDADVPLSATGEEQARATARWLASLPGQHRPDVASRLRALLGDLRRDHEGRRVLLFGHDALVFLLRYLVEGLTEAELMGLTRGHVIADCSVTGWFADAGGRLVPDTFNEVRHLRRQGARPTEEDEVHAEPV
ncbi:hypothetical protein E1193_20925 [Micromonospora sp. KC606]|uniref:phosphoglycerate mutase family protein n=1 Tax=Micromonospora sp. KC606 TaxID=2530379 RepID=UPI001049B257|nr:phosphoglycerate mutase family protein [Micromonospora sp. KC606]TDC78347.1 hypothetical protein E1193_20925 [Micromonospora sp. KC606]